MTKKSDKKLNVRNKEIIIILLIFSLIFSVCGGTLAYLNWETAEEQRTEVVFTLEEHFTCAVDGGGNVTNQDAKLRPTTCMDSEHAIKREVKVNPNIFSNSMNVYLQLYLDVVSLDSGLTNSQNFKYAFTTSDSSCTEGVIASGTFNGKTAGSQIPILDKNYTSTTTDTYYLYIWLDAEETSSTTMNQNFDITFGGTCEELEPSLLNAYAIYSEDDNSLRFYKNMDTVEEGSTYNGLTATNVYTGFEDTKFNYGGDVLWAGQRNLITSVYIEDTITPISTSLWFLALPNCTVFDLNNLDVSRVTDMNSMFSSSGTSVETIVIEGLSGWDVSNVTNMSRLFSEVGSNATTWSVGDLSGWDVSNVTNMSYMFNSAGKNATTWSVGDLSGWNVSNVTNMSYMFNSTGTNAMTWSVGDLSGWNVSNVTNMRYMFNSAGKNATTWSVGVLSDWEVSKVTNMNSMFNSAGTNATTLNLDLSGWDVSDVVDMSYMFFEAGKNATTWSIGNLSGWNVSSVTNMSYMFYSSGRNATTWSIGNLSSWSVSNVTNMNSMFYYAGSNATTWNLDLSGWDVSNVTDMKSMFNFAGRNATTWSIGNLSGWNVSSVTNMSYMFCYAGYNATTFNIGNLSGWDVSNVTDMKSMFYSAGANATTWNLNLSGWNVESVTSYDNFNTSVTDKVTAPTWVN